MEDAPEFRKHGGYTAFVEGWGLYAESLAGEMGLYQDPYSKYGQLTYAAAAIMDCGGKRSATPLWEARSAGEEKASPNFEGLNRR